MPELSDSASIPAPIPDPKGERRAVLDVGTNSVKLLVGDVASGVVEPLYETSEQTRLGEGFYESHLLQPAAIARTTAAVSRLLNQALVWQPQRVRIVATSAARDARNGHLLVEGIRSVTGLQLEIISGESEADLAFRGVTSCPGLADKSLLVLDVGGGSTEFIVGEGGEQRFSRSFPLGSVRWLEKIRPSDPPTKEEFLRCQSELANLFLAEIVPAVAPSLSALAGPPRLLGTGGASTILVRIHKAMTGFDRGEIESTLLSRRQVRDHLERLWSLPLSKRRQITGLPPERADVILTGVGIYAAVMEFLGFETLQTSTRGLRFALLLD